MNILFSQFEIDMFLEYLINEYNTVNVSSERTSHKVENA